MKEKFMEWLNSNLRDNSWLLTKGQHEIIKYLKAVDNFGKIIFQQYLIF